MNMGDYHYNCTHQELLFDAPDDGENEFQITCDKPFSQGEYTVWFIFVCKLFVDEWVWQDDAPQPVYLGRLTQTGLQTVVGLVKEQLLDFDRVYSTLEGELRHWPLRWYKRWELTCRAMEIAGRAIESKPASCSKIEVKCPVTIIHTHLLDQRSHVEAAIIQSMEEHVASMVPAAESAIESLNGIRLAMDSAETCTVCLEEIGNRCEATEMPCSHVFHGDCIKQWLRASHYCPVCRFEMPTV